jgi:FkbM family methyltransferase
MDPIKFFDMAASTDDTVLDIGAFMGQYAVALAQIVGPGGRVFAFECQPFHYAMLSRNMAQSGAKNVFTACRAISDENWFTTLNVDMNPDATASTIVPNMAVPERLGANFIRLSVETETVDHFCEEKQIAPAFIKVDVEGAEAKVLRGAMRTLARALPAMYLETTFRCHQQRIPSFPFMLEEIGYKLFLVDTVWHTDRWTAPLPTYQDEFVHPITAEECLGLGRVILNLGAIHLSKLWQDHPMISTERATDFFKRIAPHRCDAGT